MRNFHSGKYIKKRRLPLGILIFIAIMIVFLFGISSAGDTSIARQEKSLNHAMERNIVHCYALEGFYPPSLDYIKEHYGLTYDTDSFIIDYRPIASNIYPDFTIIYKGEEP